MIFYNIASVLKNTVVEETHYSSNLYWDKDPMICSKLIFRCLILTLKTECSSQRNQQYDERSVIHKVCRYPYD